MRRYLSLTVVLLLLLGSLHSGNSTLRLLSPLGGENLIRGTEYKIKWESGSLEGMVRLVLIKGETKIGRISNNLPANGSYIWKVGNPLQHPPGTTYPNGSDYKIRVVSQSVQGVRDQSPRNFSISGMLQRDAQFTFPPRLMQFDVTQPIADSGRLEGQSANIAGSRQVLLISRVMGGGASDYRVQVGGEWSEWRSPYQAQIYYHIPDNNCQEHTISFQVRNDQGQSNIMTKQFTYVEDRPVTLLCGETGEYAKQNGFTHLILSKDSNAQPEIQFQLPSRMMLVVSKKDRLKYAEAVFEIFGGREMNPGWGFQEYTVTLPTGYGGYKVIRKPAVNSRDIKYQVKVWIDGGVTVHPYAWLQIDLLKIKGPCNKDWRLAFQR